MSHAGANSSTGALLEPIQLLDRFHWYWSRFHVGIGSTNGSFGPWNRSGIGSRKIGIISSLVRDVEPLDSLSLGMLHLHLATLWI